LRAIFKYLFAVSLALGFAFFFGPENGEASTIEKCTEVYSPLAHSVTLIGYNVSCKDSCDGAAKAVVTGGSGNFAYTWLGGPYACEPGDSICNLCVGTYTVIVEDIDFGGFASDDVSITEPAEIGIIITPPSPTTDCFGTCDGSATAIPIGGNGSPYTFLWAPSSETTATAVALCAGANNVLVMDSIGCRGDTTITVAEPAPLIGTPTSTDVSCAGIIPCDGKIVVSASGGTPPYTHSWSTGQVTNNSVSDSIVLLCAATYTDTVIDSNGCRDTVIVTIIEPLPLVLTMSKTDESCGGACDGTATVTIAGGTGPFTYLWDDGQTTSTAIGLCNDPSFCVTVTDNNGCQESGCVAINSPPLLTTGADSVDVLCNGDSTGQAIAMPAGGTFPYFYLWNTSPAQTDSIATGLPAGTYTVTVTDNLGCQDIDSTVVNEPPPITLSTVKVDPTCTGSCDGTATVTAGGGNGAPYTYLWDDGQTTSTAIGLCANPSFCVTVTDGSGVCFDTACVILVDPVVMTLVTDSQDVTCFGLSDGDAIVTPSGGTLPYTYIWSNGDTDSIADNVPAGPYCVTVTDNNGCSKDTCVNIDEPTDLVLTTDSTDITCGGTCNGIADVFPSGSNPPYTYAWCTVPIQTNSSATGLCPGMYCVTVTDSTGCTETDSVNIDEPPVLTLSMSKTDITCFGLCDGTGIAIPGGGTLPYTYLWDDPLAQTDSIATGLCAGIFRVTVTDFLGCTLIDSVNIIEPPVLTLSTSKTDDLCNKAPCTGTGTATAGGGSGPYTYLWSDGQTTSTATGLCAGTFYVTLTDSTGCTLNDSVLIAVPPPISPNSASSDATCGFNNGSASVSPTGGNPFPAYTFLWYDAFLGPFVNDTIFNQPAGIYNVEITDGSGCQDTFLVTINNTSTVLLTTDSIDTGPCNADCNGEIRTSPTGGTSPFTYLWDDPTACTTDTCKNICAGVYIVMVEDAAGCITFDSTRVNEPTVLLPNVTGTNVLCFGDANGTVVSTPSGGGGGYTHLWNTGATTPFLISLSPGTYTDTVTDANGCKRFESYTVTDQLLLTVTTDSTDELCFGDTTGIAEVHPTGGVAPYAFSWDAGGTPTDSININLAVGTYNVTVTDNNGCTTNASVNIDEPPALVLNADSTNLTCNGAGDGQAYVIVTGGTGLYTYLWDDPLAQTNDTAQSLSAGTYCVTVTDNNGCIDSACVVVNEPLVLSTSTAGTNLACNAICIGTGTVTPIGGTSPYTFLWSDGGAQTNATAIGLCAGNFYVTVTDSNSCTTVDSVTITEPLVLALTTDSTDVLPCFGDATGIAEVHPTGGTSPYTFLWNTLPAQTDSIATGLIIGTYCVTVTDANGCIDSACVNIDEPAILAPNFTTVDATCGVCDGGAKSAPTGGLAPYTFHWFDAVPPVGPGSVDSISLQCAGVYNLRLIDANGCVDTFAIGINNLGAPTIDSVDSTGVTCFGDCDGTATVYVTPASGNPPYTYAWNDPPPVETDSFADSLCAGPYIVVVTDNIGCIVTASTTVTTPPQLVMNLSGKNITCNGACDGEVYTVPSGGVGALSHIWTPGGATTDTVVGLCAAKYIDTITDITGCIVVDSITLTEPAVLGVSITDSTNISCNGVCDGTATVTVTGGTPPYTYVWTNGDSDTLADSLCAGIPIKVVVTDSNNCSDSVIVTLSEPAVLTATITDSTNLLCNAICTGDATVTAAGGTAPYTYDWVSAGSQTDTIATGLCAGLDTVVVTDTMGCVDTATVALSEPAVLVVSITDSVKISCNGICDGSLTGTPVGGTAPYTYAWNTTPVQTDSIATGLCGGFVDTLIVIDSLACTDTIVDTLMQPGILSVNIIDSTNISCFNFCDGTATAGPTGGAPIFTYSWSNGDTDSIADSLCAGTIDTVIITDGGGCVDTAYVTLSEPAVLTVSITDSTNISCNGVCDGTATVTAGGGTPPYTYVWSNGDSDTLADSLCAGIPIQVLVTDSNGCVDSVIVTLSEPPVLTATITDSTNLICNGICTGDATVTAAGGTAPYTYNWVSAGSQTDTTATGLCAGLDTVLVTDSMGCVDIATVALSEPAVLIVSITDSTKISCTGICDGSLTGTPVGGTAPYTYLWNNGDTDSIADSLCGGFIDTLIVIDSNACTDTIVDTLMEPGVLVANIIDSTNISCNGFCDGTATADATGGSGTLTFTWSNGDTDSIADSLCAGTIDTVIITDGGGCVDTAYVTLSEPAVLTVSITDSTNISCNGACDGTATVTAGGGTTPYTYIWTNGDSDTLADSLCAGIPFQVVVTDSNSCSDSVIVTLSEPAVLTATITDSTNITCNGDSTGDATVTAVGGNPLYTYAWSTAPVQTDTTATGLLGDSLYTVVITDSMGCTVTDSVMLSQSTPIVITFTDSTAASCNGVCDGSATVSVSGGNPPYTYLWNDPALQTDTVGDSLCAGFNTITVTDSTGCTQSDSINILEPTVLTVDSVTITEASCDTTCDATATVTGNGGVPPYTYLWDNGDTGVTADSLCASTFNVSVTDSNGCTANNTIIVTGPLGLASSITDTTMVSCNGVSDGTATVNATGGNPPYTYLWQDTLGNTVQTGDTVVTGLPAEGYIVYVTDSTGCITSVSFIITEPLPLLPNICNIQNVTCNSFCDGKASVCITGGTPPYSISWSTVPVQTDTTATGMCAGTYTVNVIDANGCTAVDSLVIISEPTFLSCAFTDTVNVDCDAIPNGSITVTPSGGTPPYSYAWNTVPQQFDSIADSQFAGCYDVTITDNNNCSALCTGCIVDTSNMNATIVNQVNVSCNGACDGSAEVDVTGSVTPYTYEWVDSVGLPIGQNDTVATGLCAGLYRIIVTSSALCVRSMPVEISEPDTLFATVGDSTDVLCNGDSTGSITMAPSGGNPPYTYSWTDSAGDTIGSDTSFIDSLPAGTYCIVVTDSISCSDSTCVTIGEPPVLSSSITDTVNAACSNTCDGGATVTPAGGVGNYSYIWLPDSTTDSTVTGLCVGSFTVIVSDSNGCQVTDTAVISAAVTVNASAAPDTSVCEGDSVTLVGTGGSICAWYNIGDSVPFSNSCSETILQTTTGSVTYLLVVTDSICSDTDSVSIFVIPISADAGTGDTIPTGNCTTIGTAAVGTYTYSWSPTTGLNDPNIAMPVACPDENTTYTLTVTNDSGCTKLDSVIIVVNPEVPDGFSPNGDGHNDVWEIALLSSYPKSSVRVYNRWGEKVFNSPEGDKYATKFDGKFNGKDLPIGTYYYVIELNDGITDPLTGPVTILR